MEYLIDSFLSRKKILSISETSLSFDGEVFSKNEIIEFRHGINWINGYEFTIGRVYVIELKTSGGELIKIKLRSVYGINKKSHNQKYFEIKHHIFNFYFIELINHYINNINDGNEINLLNTTISIKGIKFSNQLYSWDKIDVKLYYSYFTIYEIGNKKNYIAFDFAHAWNAEVLYFLLEKIITFNKTIFVDHST